MNKYTLENLEHALALKLRHATNAQALAESIHTNREIRRFTTEQSIALFKSLRAGLSVLNSEKKALAEEALALCIYWTKLDAGADEELALAELEGRLVAEETVVAQVESNATFVEAVATPVEAVVAVEAVQTTEVIEVLGWTAPAHACIRASFQAPLDPQCPTPSQGICLGISRKVSGQGLDLLRNAQKIALSLSSSSAGPSDQTSQGDLHSGFAGSTPGHSSYGTGPPGDFIL